MPLIIPPDDCCGNDDCGVAAHAATGWCLEDGGAPVVVVTTRECVNGVPGAVTVTLIDPSTGAVVPPQNVVPCGGASLTVPDSTVYDCDDEPSIVPALPVVIRGRVDALLCENQNVQIVPGDLTALGHEQITVTNVPVGLTVPVGARIALIENAPFGPVGTVRWRDDGGVPVGGGTAGIGHYIRAGVSIEYAADLAGISFVRDAAQNGSLEISYYS